MWAPDAKNLSKIKTKVWTNKLISKKGQKKEKKVEGKAGKTLRIA